MEKHINRLLTIEGFMQAFYEFLPDCKNQEDAYEALERQYYANFGKRKYKTFESFRQCRDRILKIKKTPQDIKM